MFGNCSLLSVQGCCVITCQGATTTAEKCTRYPKPTWFHGCVWWCSHLRSLRIWPTRGRQRWFVLKCEEKKKMVLQWGVRLDMCTSFGVPSFMSPFTLNNFDTLLVPSALVISDLWWGRSVSGEWVRSTPNVPTGDGWKRDFSVRAFPSLWHLRQLCSQHKLQIKALNCTLFLALETH